MTERNNDLHWESTFIRADDAGLTLRDILHRAGRTGNYLVINFVRSACEAAEARAKKMDAASRLHDREGD